MEPCVQTSSQISAHTRYPLMTKAFLGICYEAGAIVRTEQENQALKKFDECLGPDGIHHEDLSKLENLLEKLSEKEREVLVAGELEDLENLLSLHGEPAENLDSFLDNCYEYYRES